MFGPQTTNRRRARRGTTTALVAILLTVLVGVTAIAIDGGLLQDNKRRVQAASDAAALAAGSTLFQNYPKIVATATPDPSGEAKAAALAAAAANGFTPNSSDASTTGTTSGGVTSVGVPAGGATVAVHIPPVSGPFTGKTGYVEVIITYYQPRYFSTIWGATAMPVTARSVAVGKWAGSGNGIIVLDPLAAHALDGNGTGALTVTGGASVIVNSKHPDAAARTSGGGTMTAQTFNVTGGTEGVFNGTVVKGTPPVPDPLAYLPVPAAPPLGTMTKTTLGNGNKLYVLSPGRYTNLPSFQQGDIVMLQQASAGNGGIFYLDGGGFSSQGGNIIMDPTTSGGVMIYNKPSSQSSSQGINITGNASGNVSLSALSSGPYAGILFFQERSSTQTMSVSGNGSFDLTGTFYTANALLSVSGSGTATIGSQYISRTLSVSGGGNITINYSESGTSKTREVYLVE